jgi:hypothetical protein
VIPILTDNARMPTEADLPGEDVTANTGDLPGVRECDGSGVSGPGLPLVDSAVTTLSHNMAIALYHLWREREHIKANTTAVPEPRPPATAH